MKMLKADLVAPADWNSHNLNIPSLVSKLIVNLKIIYIRL